MAVILAVAMVLASFAAVAIAQNSGCDDCSVLGQAEFLSNPITFVAGQDTNIDQLEVGNDKAFAYGPGWGWAADPHATNNLLIEKSQHAVDNCSPCCTENSVGLDCEACKNGCSVVNIEQIKVGSRTATAIGPSTWATNNVKIVATQT
ncbi:MAG: hypothetical protein MUO26_05855 [Methanotrichaceae archaeon]|nr:hypothetical protein [Methanotrichaceae archaeon]